MRWPFGERESGVLNTPAPLRSDPKEEILQGCWRVENMIYANSSTLPTLGSALALRTVDVERQICALSTYLRADVTHTLSATMNDYLPTLIDTYLRAALSGAREEAKFNDQVNTILESTLKVLQAVKSDNVQAMEAQSLFLESKFGGSDLE